MIRHSVMFQFHVGTAPEAVEALAAGLRALPAVIPAIRGYLCGPDVGANPGNWDFCVSADFDDIDGYLTYRDHPAHQQAIADFVTPITAARHAVQFAY